GYSGDDFCWRSGLRGPPGLSVSDQCRRQRPLCREKRRPQSRRGCLTAAAPLPSGHCDPDQDHEHDGGKADCRQRQRRHETDGRDPGSGSNDGQNQDDEGQQNSEHLATPFIAALMPGLQCKKQGDKLSALWMSLASDLLVYNALASYSCPGMIRWACRKQRPPRSVLPRPV